MVPQNNEIYRHFKGNLYKVITLAMHSETKEQMVVYQGLYGNFPVYCRPLSLFFDRVDPIKYPGSSQKLRFEKVDTIVSADTSVKLAEPWKNDQEDSLSENCMINVSESVEEVSQSNMDKTAGLEQGQGAQQEMSMQQSDADDISEVDPLILEFLDAGTIIEKKNILAALHHRITDHMINTLAVVMDVVIEEGELEDRYQQLKTCLDTIERYEIERK